MAPLGFVTSGISLLAKSFSVLSCTGSLARSTRVLPAAYTIPVKGLTSQASDPPKRPLNGYMRYVQQQKPVLTMRNPEIKIVDIIKMIAQEWRTMSPDQKRPYTEAFMRDNRQFKVDLQRYRAQLTPAQIQQQALEKRRRTAQRKAIRKKRELNSLGKPKRPRSAFNIYMSEHFQEAKGSSMQGKLKSLLEEWRNLLGDQQKVYTQLAEDDKIRYKNEMKSWEDHMASIGRQDLIRELTLSSQKKPAARTAAKPKKVVKKKKKAAAAKTKTAAKSKTNTTKASKT